MKPGDIWPAVECGCQVCGQTFLVGRMSMNERIWDLIAQELRCPECANPAPPVSDPANEKEGV